MKQNNLLPLLCISLLALGLTSCVVEEPLDPEPEPQIENLPPNPGNAGLTTVAGVDSDRDGIRDDVQIHIHTTYNNVATRAAATQLTKAFQTMMISGGTKTAALTAGESMNRAIDCLYSLDASSFGNIVDEIEGVVVNTEDRARAYAKAGSFLSGGSFQVSSIADNSVNCVEAP